MLQQDLFTQQAVLLICMAGMEGGSSSTADAASLLTCFLLPVLLQLSASPTTVLPACPLPTGTWCGCQPGAAEGC